MFNSPFLDNRSRIYENKIGFVIFDKYPVSKGHCLIVPHRIYSNYFDSSEEEIIGLNKLLFKTKKFLDENYNPSGYNIGINCGEVSGQTVDHLHIHIIPRYLNDVEDPRGGIRGVIPDKQKYK
jgi:diadenosine tetraphosphate (Ap4A) HIT family hydrolase